MRRIATFIVDHPQRILGLTGLISVLAVVSLFRIQFNADVASFITEGNERGEAFAALQEKYQTSDPVNVVLSLPEGETFGDRARLIDLAAFRDDLAKVDGVASVVALVPPTNPLDGSAITPAFVAAAPEALLNSVAAGPLSELLLSENGRHTMLLVVPGDDGIAVARAVGEMTPPQGTEVTVAGNPAVYAAVVDILSLFLLLIPPTVLVLLVATFYANVGERRLTVLAVVPALLGSLWTFGVIAASGREIDVVTVIVPIFVLVMGSADGLHFVTHFQDVSRETSNPLERVVSTLREVGTPMILTTISTAAGFMSLLVTDIRPVRQLGLFAAVGITFAGAISFFSLPAIMTRIGVSSAHEVPALGSGLTRALRWLVVRRWPAPALVAVVAVFAAVFIPRLQVDSDPLFMFAGDHEVRQAFERTEELFGGATPLAGEFAFDPSDPQRSLQAATAASSELEALPGVRAVFSAIDLASALPPDTVASALSGSGNLPIGDLVSEDGLRFLLLPEQFSTEDLRGWLDFADQNETVRIITGLPVLWDEMARLILRAQVGSVIAALVLVALMLFVTYRRIRPTLVALVPLVLTIAALLGFIAASGIQLNLITAVASSIVIGVGIDYAIHFVAAIDNARSGGPGYVLRAIDRAGRPILANALGIAVALSALLLSPLRPHHHISGIMWVSMTVAALGALLVIPSLLSREGVESATG
ncbi:MAG TPA: MMPL family transporter [Acidimicrobiia bacterium]